jgi:hypothetical protein
MRKMAVIFVVIGAVTALAACGSSFFASRSAGTSAATSAGTGALPPAHHVTVARHNHPKTKAPPHHRHSHDPSLNLAKRQNIASAVANIDYADEGYGRYDPSALTDPWIQGVVISMSWRWAETRRGVYDWAPLDKEATAWADAGKHVVLAVDFSNSTGGECSAGSGQSLPTWEIARIPTYCDSDMDVLIPDWFNPTFQSDAKAFVAALAQHVQAQPYYDAISYVRISVGMGSTAFAVMPDGGGGALGHAQEDYGADMAWMERHWGYTPQKWEAFQETMLAAYSDDFPAPVSVIYPVAKQDINPATGNPVDVDVAEWGAPRHIGIGSEGMLPGGFGGGQGYADLNTIIAWMHQHYPGNYIQVQSANPPMDASQVAQSVSTAERYGIDSIEWYQQEAVNGTFKPAMDGYQTWAAQRHPLPNT